MYPLRAVAVLIKREMHVKKYVGQWTHDIHCCTT